MQKLLIYGSIFSPTIPLLALFSVAKDIQRLDRWIISYLIASFAFDLTALALALNRIPTYTTIHIFGLVEFIILIHYFSSLFKWKNPTLISFAYGSIYMVNSIFFEPIEAFNPIMRSLTSLGYIGLIVIHFALVFKNESEIFIEKTPRFWYSIAILTYFSGALFSYLLSLDILSRPMNNFLYSWAFHNIANILKNLLFAIGLWKIRAA